MRPLHSTTLALAFGIAAVCRGQTTTLTGGFLGTTLDSGWTVGGSGYTPTLTANGGGDSPGSGWLELTSSAGNESTYALDTTAFASANATITATFNYAAFNGSGADGITFFLANAAVPFSVGAFGGSLGYAQKTAAGGGGANINGMAGGYLGIGIDEFGNYSNPTEGRIGGIGLTPNAIAVRGPGSGLTGYDYLGGSGSLATPLSYPGQTTRPSGSEAETIQMVLTATNQLTVSIEFGNSGVFVTEFTANLSGYTRPNDLVMGFTGSTGGSTDIHEVQDVALTSVVANLWTNTAGNSTWGTQGTATNDTNWANSPASNPATGGDILLNNTYVSTAQNITVTGNQVIRNLQIDAPFSYTLTGGSLEFNGSSAIGPSGILVSETNGTATQTVNSNITADNAIEIQNNTTSTLALTGTVGLGANAATFNGSGNTTVSGIVSGTGASIVQSGTGDTTLSGANTYTGGTSISAGTLTANNNSALGTGSVTLSGGILASTAASSISNAIALTGSAGLTGITTRGALTQTGGSYTLNMENATQSGGVAISNSATAQTLTVETDSGTSTISGVIANGSTSTGDALTKTGVGTLVLSGVNTYTGATTLNAGTLQIGVNNAINTASNLTLAGGTTLALNGFSDKVGNLTITGNSTLNFGSGGTNAFVFGSLTDASNNILTVSNFSGTDALATTTATLASSLLNDIYFAGSGSGTVEAASTTTNDGVASYKITANTTYTTWNGSGANNSWTTGANWVGGTAPASANTTKVDFTGSTRLTPTLTGNTTINAMRFDTAASAFTIAEAGNTITLSGTVPSIIQQSASAQTISGGTLALGANAIVDVTGAGALNISSVVSGTGFSIEKVDGGTLNLSGANTYTGGTTIGGGILGVSTSGSALGTGAVSVANGATLQVTGSNSLTLANALTINGSGSVNGAIDSNLGASTFTTTLTGGITLGSNSTISSDVGTLAITTGAITGSGNNLILTGAGTTTISSAIATGTGSLTLNGTGTTTLSGANTYTGTTTVNSGTLNLSSASNPIVNGNLTINGGTTNETTANQIGSASTVAVNGGTLALASGVAQTLTALNTAAGSNISLASGAALTLNNAAAADIFGTISGAGSLTTENTGTTVLSGANTYSGGTTTSSIVNVTNNASFGTGAVAVTAGGNVQIENNVTLANGFNLNSTGTAFAGAFENVSGNNTVSGPVTVSGASRIQSDSGTLTVSGAVGLGANSLDVGGNSNVTISGAITGTAASSLAKDGTGTLVLAAANPSFAGSVAVNAGILQTNVAGAFTSSNAITVASGATLNTNGFNQTVGAFADNGALNLGTNSILTLTGASSLDGTLSGSGTIILNAGSTLTLGANFSDSGINIDLNGGTLDLNGTDDTFGALTVTANSTMDFGAGTNSTVNFSSTTMSGASTLAVTDWTNLQDYFYSQSLTGASSDVRGTAPEDQITFTGFTAASTEWDAASKQITPVPEPSEYGAILVGLSAALAVIFRNRSSRRATVA